MDFNTIAWTDIASNLDFMIVGMSFYTDEGIRILFRTHKLNITNVYNYTEIYIITIKTFSEL